MVDSMAGETASFGVEERFPCGRIANASSGSTLSGGHDHMDQTDQSGARNVYR